MRGVHVLERDFLTVAAFIAPVLWLTGAVLLLKRTDVGYYIVSVFFVAMTRDTYDHVRRAVTAAGFATTVMPMPDGGTRFVCASCAGRIGLTAWSLKKAVSIPGRLASCSPCCTYLMNPPHLTNRWSGPPARRVESPFRNELHRR